MTTTRDRWWQIGVWVFLVVGVTGSVFGARLWHNKLQAKDRGQLASQESDLAVSVGAGLGRDTDFVAGLRSLVATTPDMGNTQFQNWVVGVGAAARYPGGLGYGFFEQVPTAGLAAFVAKIRADPPEGPITTYDVTPPGTRASYCLLRFDALTVTVPSDLPFPVGLDVCAPDGYLGLSSTFVGGPASQFTVVAVAGGIVAIGAPVYVSTPATGTAAATSTLIGWISGTFAGVGLLPDASTHPGLQVQVLYRNTGAAQTVVGTSGAAPKNGAVIESLKVSADGPWTVNVAGVSTGAGSSWAQPGAVLIGGLLISLGVFGFVQVLARGRRRAQRLVIERTGQLHHQALHDALTDLPNRALILDRIEQMLARGRRDRTPTAVLFMDLDGFKDVNDTYGHATGDRLLQAVGRRITATLRSRDTVGRLGGDEFVVLVEGADVEPDLVAERLLAVFREPFVLDEVNQVFVTTPVSIGIASGDRANAGDLLRDADIALYKAKDAGGDRFAMFSPGMQTGARDRVELATDLRHALAAGQFFLAYQPTFSLRDMAVTGVEALIRWHHPTRGDIQPDDFIPLAEDIGLIIPIGRWVLDTACAEAVTWQSPERRLSIAVNVSGRQLDYAGLVDDVAHALAHSGLPPELLTLEITETVLMHDAAAGAARLHDLKALGVRISIDDFGTGYSSLAYLSQFPTDALKIDRSFIAAMADSPESRAIVRTLIQLGKALGIETLAEGIEQRTQLDHLQKQDCDNGQGFLFARPLTPQALQALLTPTPVPVTAVTTSSA